MRLELKLYVYFINENQNSHNTIYFTEKGESSSSNSTGNKITGKKLRIKSQKIKGFLNNQAKKAKNISKSQFDKLVIYSVCKCLIP